MYVYFIFGEILKQNYEQRAWKSRYILEKQNSPKLARCLSSSNLNIVQKR
jgi:hypothetical protein